MKKILSLVLILAVLLAMVLPLAVSADTSVNGHVLSQPTVSAVLLADDVTPAHGLPSAGSGSGNITVHIVGTNFDVVTDYTPNDPMPTITVTAHGFTATAGSVTGTVTSVTDATHLTATFVVAAASTSGYYDVQVSQGGLTSPVNYTADRFIVNSYGTVTPPSDIHFNLMTVGTTVTANDITTGGLVSNDLTWQMTVADANTGAHKGHMLSGGNALTSAFRISQDSTAGDFADSDAGLTAGTNYPATGTALPLYVKQAIAAGTGDAAGTYSIVIKFTYATTY
jgi:hypothetical protein